MLNLTNDTQVYTGILTPFHYESDILIVIKNNSERVYAKLGEGVGINPFNHYFARVSIVKAGTQNVAVEIDYIAENLDKTLLKTLLANVPQRSDEHLDNLLRQLMCISDPLLRHLILDVLCDNAILPLLLSSVAENDSSKTLFESIVDSTSFVIEQLHSADMLDLDRDCLIAVSLLWLLLNNQRLRQGLCEQHRNGHNMLDFIVVKLQAIKQYAIADKILKHLAFFTTEFEFMYYIKQIVEVRQEGLSASSLLELSH